MLLLPSNTLVLDEPTNHLDLDSKDVLLDALEDYGGTLLFVSHDRYFVERLATKVVDVGGGRAESYPGTYAEFLWRKGQGAGSRPPPAAASTRPTTRAKATPAPPVADKAAEHDARKRDAAERKKRERAFQALTTRIADLEARIAEREAAVKSAEAAMSAPGFYDDRDASKAVLDRHQSLMWEVGELLGQWEMLQAEAETLKARLSA